MARARSAYQQHRAYSIDLAYRGAPTPYSRKVAGPRRSLLFRVPVSESAISGWNAPLYYGLCDGDEFLCATPFNVGVLPNTGRAIKHALLLLLPLPTRLYRRRSSRQKAYT